MTYRKILDLFQINFVANKKVILHILSTNFCDTRLPFKFPIFLFLAFLLYLTSITGKYKTPLKTLRTATWGRLKSSKFNAMGILQTDVFILIRLWYKTRTNVFSKNRKIHSKIQMESQGIPNIQNNLKKEKQS